MVKPKPVEHEMVGFGDVFRCSLLPASLRFASMVAEVAMTPDIERVPVLVTERLALRRHRLDDFPYAARMWGDPAVTRHVGGRPFTQEEVWARIMRYVGHWELLGYGYWAIEERDTGRFVGEAGFADFHRDMEPSLADIPELGWVLTPSAQGRGYATEAAQAAVAWGDRRFDRAKTACIIHPENTASIRVAAKVGYREVQATTYKGHPIIVFER
jgi:RimJ/RimL family protein N-acetyltransferase